MSSQNPLPLISIVIPVFNEERMIPALLGALCPAVAECPQYRWELVMVDDGSSDHTVAEIERHRLAFPGSVLLVQFSRNFGHQPALVAGLHRTSGEAVGGERLRRVGGEVLDLLE